MPETLYVDASAAVKLVVEEAESWALADRLGGAVLISSDVCRVELARTLLRLGLGIGAVQLGRGVVHRIEMLRLDTSVLDRACSVGPSTLRGLDAIHLASALELDRDVDAFVTYDQRLAEAAGAQGLLVLSPA